MFIIVSKLYINEMDVLDLVLNLSKYVNLDNAFSLDYLQLKGQNTEVGELLESLKTKRLIDIKSDPDFEKILSLVKSHLVHLEYDFIIPVPEVPTVLPKLFDNSYKKVQDTLLYKIVKEISLSFSKPYSTNVLKKLTFYDSRYFLQTPGDYFSEYIPLQNATILILDDITRSMESVRFLINEIKDKNPHLSYIYISIASLPKKEYTSHCTICKVTPDNEDIIRTAKNGNDYIVLTIESKIKVYCFEGSPGFKEISEEYENSNGEHDCFKVLLSFNNGYYNIAQFLEAPNDFGMFNDYIIPTY